MTRRGAAEVLSAGHRFLEAPRWHRGSLYASDVFDRRVVRWTSAGDPESVWNVPGEPCGLAWDPGGRALVVSTTDRRLLRETGTGLEEFADLSSWAPWHLNDLVVDAAGRAYVSNLGWDDERVREISPTVLLRVDPDGTVAVVADGLVNPNGMVITPDGRTLLVAETFAARITAFSIASGGSLSHRRLWAQFDEREFRTMDEAFAGEALLPDGIALDAEGALWIGDPRGHGAVRVEEGGRVIGRVETGAFATFAVALGGPDGRTLFLCTAGRFESVADLRRRDGAMCFARVGVAAARVP
ncbi:gluconolactonase [Thermoleophilia bacterium SCSIO 60948]|nr:gluconolactonase [Thermoleophilia bacterium SCSIO 60948]